MIKVPKSKLVEKLKYTPLNQIDNYTAFFIGGCYGDWLHLRRKTGKRTMKLTTLGVIMLIRFFLYFFRALQCKWNHFLNEPYHLEMSIKDSEHDRREEASSDLGRTRNSLTRKEDRLPPPKEFQSLFKNLGSKIHFQHFLRSEFSSFSALLPNINFIYSLRNKC